MQLNWTLELLCVELTGNVVLSGSGRSALNIRGITWGSRYGVSSGLEVEPSNYHRRKTKMLVRALSTKNYLIARVCTVGSTDETNWFWGIKYFASLYMDKQCAYCCGLFWFGKRSSSSGNSEAAKSSSSKPGIVKRISKEHLLSYSVEAENLEAATHVKQLARKQSAAELPLNTHYCPPCKLAESVGSRGPLVLPLLRAGVKETRHEFRSQVTTLTLMPTT